MNKCLLVTVSLRKYSEDLVIYIQKSAKANRIEGTIRALDKGTLEIIACSDDDNLDKFIDDIYKGYKSAKPISVEIEPFLKDRDYRGVFRIIE